MIAFGLRGPMFDPSGWQKFFSTEYIIGVRWILGFWCKRVWRFGKNDVSEAMFRVEEKEEERYVRERCRERRRDKEAA